MLGVCFVHSAFLYSAMKVNTCIIMFAQLADADLSSRHCISEFVFKYVRTLCLLFFLEYDFYARYNDCHF